MFKRFLSLLVTVTMLVALLPAGVFAEGDAAVTQIVEQVVAEPQPEQEQPTEEPKQQEPQPPTQQPQANEATEPTQQPEEGDATEPTQAPVEDPAAQAIAQANAALAALPDDITWNAFAAVEAAGAALAAVPAERQAEVEGADKLTAAIETLLAIYAQAQAALDPGADIWENQHAIKAFVQMKAQMDAAQYVKPAADGDISLMDEATEPADYSWLTAALNAYENAEATIIPDGESDDMSLMATATDYQTLQAALDAVKKNNTIKINKDVELTEQLVAKTAVAYTINTNKKTLTFKANGADDTAPTVGVVGFLVTAGTVTIKGGGEFVTTGDDINTVLCVTDNAAAVTLDGVNMTASYGYSNSDDYGRYGVAVYQSGATLTIKNSTLTATNQNKSAGVLFIQGKDNDNRANVNISSTTLNGGWGLFATDYLHYELNGVIINAYSFGITNETSKDSINNSVTGSIQNCTLHVKMNCAIIIENSEKLTISNTTIEGRNGIRVATGTVTMKDIVLDVEYTGLNINPNSTNTGDVAVTVDDTSISSTSVSNPICVQRPSEGKTDVISLTIKDSTLTAPDGKSPIYVSGLTDDDIAAITLENTVTNTALQAGTYTLAEGQRLFGTIEGGSAVAKTLSDAMLLSDIKLIRNYTNADEPITVAKGSVLDAEECELNVKSVTVNGRMEVKGYGSLTTETTVTSTGLLYIDDVLYIAPKDEEVFGKKAVLGLSKGAEMTVKANAADGVDFTLKKGEATIQTPIGDELQFELPENYTLQKATGTKIKIWLAADVDVKSLRGIADGTLSYELVKIGSRVYDNLPEAITAGGTIKVMRNLTGMFAVTKPSMVTKAFTLDLQGYTVDFDFDDKNSAGLEFAPEENANFTIKNGTLNKISDGETMVPFIVAGNQANITLDGVTAKLSGTGNDTVLVQDGATVTVINKSAITSTDCAVQVTPGGKLVAKNSKFEGNMDYQTLIAYGAENKAATIELDNIIVDGTIALGDYVSLSMNACTVTGKKLAIYNEGYLPSTDITITGGTLKTTAKLSEGFAIFLTFAKTLNMTDTVIDSAYYGILVYNGEIELKNVTINAKNDALMVIANKDAGSQPIKLTVNGGAISSANRNALYYCYEGNETTAENKPLTITLNNTKLYAPNAAAPIGRSQNMQTKVSVNGITTKPYVNTDLLTIAEGQKVFSAVTTEGNGMNYIRKTLSEAIADMAPGTTVVLEEKYVNADEAITLPNGISLQMNKADTGIEVSSIVSYGTIDATYSSQIAVDGETGLGGSILVDTLELRANGSYTGSLKIDNLSQLGATTVNVVPCFKTGTSIYEYGNVTIGGVKMIDKAGATARFGLGDNAEMGVCAKTVGEGGEATTATEYVVYSGNVVIQNTTENGSEDIFDFTTDYLTIGANATVTVGKKVTVNAAENHISGVITYADVAAFEAAVQNLPELDALSYEHYDAVEAAIKAREAVEEQGHISVPAAQTAKTKLETYTANDLYLYSYIATDPELVVVSPEGGMLEQNGAASEAIDISYRADLPQKVIDLLATAFDSSLAKKTEGDEKLTIDQNTVKATDKAEVNDVLTVQASYTSKANGTPAWQSVPKEISFRVVPNATGAELQEIVLSSYSHTVNLQYRSQNVNIPVLFAYDNGMQYDLKDYTIARDGVEINDVGSQKLSYRYDAAYENGVLTLTRNKTSTGGNVELAKNKTYTGTVTFTATKNGNSKLFTTGVISVKVTDVKPKVTVKLGTLQLFANKEEGVGNVPAEYNFIYKPVSFTITGANAKDVVGISCAVDNVNGISYEYDEVNGLYVYSKNALPKGTYKPVLTLRFATDESGNGFKAVWLTKDGTNNSIGTVPLKTALTYPAIKLKKTSATISSGAGAKVEVGVVATNSKNPFDLTNISDVTVYEKNGKTLGEANVLARAIYNEDSHKIKITTQKDITKKATLVLRLTFENSTNTMDLSFTLNVKPLAVKLSRSGVEMNLRNEVYEGYLPLTVTPESDKVTLERVGVVVGKKENMRYRYEGVVDTDDVEFECNDNNKLYIYAYRGNLVKGAKKYNLYFTGLGKPLSFTVKVVEKYDTVKLGKSSISVNTTFNDIAEIPVVYSTGKLSADQVEIQCSKSVRASYVEEKGMLEVQLSPDAAKTETVLITVKDANTDPKKSTLKLSVKKVDKPIAMSAKVTGKLNVLDANSQVTATVSFSGTAAHFNVKKMVSELVGFGTNTTFTAVSNVLEVKSFTVNEQKNTAVVQLGWKNGANLLKGAGKLSFGLNMSYVANAYEAAPDTQIKLDLSPAKPVSVTAALPKVKPTASAVTLYQALPYKMAAFIIDGGDSAITVTNVALAKASPYYVLEKLGDKYYLRYKEGFAGFGKKWKATDSVSLTVTVAGVAKPYTVKLPIVNVQAQPPATE